MLTLMLPCPGQQIVSKYLCSLHISVFHGIEWDAALSRTAGCQQCSLASTYKLLVSQYIPSSVYKIDIPHFMLTLMLPCPGQQIVSKYLCSLHISVFHGIEWDAALSRTAACQQCSLASTYKLLVSQYIPSSVYKIDIPHFMLILMLPCPGQQIVSKYLCFLHISVCHRMRCCPVQDSRLSTILSSVYIKTLSLWIPSSIYKIDMPHFMLHGSKANLIFSTNHQQTTSEQCEMLPSPWAAHFYMNWILHSLSWSCLLQVYPSQFHFQLWPSTNNIRAVWDAATAHFYMNWILH